LKIFNFSSQEAPEDASKPLDLSCAVAGLLFTDLKLEQPWYE
jgi:hypothetical protein